MTKQRMPTVFTVPVTSREDRLIKRLLDKADIKDKIVRYKIHALLVNSLRLPKQLEREVTPRINPFNIRERIRQAIELNEGILSNLGEDDASKR